MDALVAGAPEALDTLIELANALNNDPNFAATMATELGKKINVSDIVNNLTSGGTGKVLSAEQGKVLKAALDTHNHAGVYEPVFSKNTAFNKNFGTTSGTVCQGNDSRLSDARTPKAHTHKKSEISDFPASMPASDVPAWAKATNKPSYTASEVGASPSNHNHAGTYEPAFTKKTAFNKDFGTAVGTVCEGNDARLSNARTPLAHSHKKADISDFPTSMPASDVPAWAKATKKPTYTASEVGASPSNHNHDADYQPKGSYAAASHSHSASDITEVTNKKFMTDAEKNALSSLGTTYALKDFSNIGVKSLGQNGYRKYDDGLLIQWGYSSTSGIGKTVYLNTTFYDSNYTIQLTGTRLVHSNYMYSFDVYSKYASYFVMDSVYHNNDSDAGGFSIAFYWFAIGRWK